MSAWEDDFIPRGKRMANTGAASRSGVHRPGWSAAVSMAGLSAPMSLGRRLAPNGASSTRQERHRHARAGNRRITVRRTSSPAFNWETREGPRVLAIPRTLTNPPACRR